MTTIQAQPVEMVLRNTVERVDILVVDADGQPMNATELVFQLRRIDDTVIYEEDFINAPSRIVNPGTGRYYFPMGDTALVANENPETGTCGDFLCVWQVTGPVGSEQVSIVQVVMVVSAYSMSLLPDLRMQIDKAAKMVSDDPSNPCFLGYTDSQLMRFLLNGLTIWNLYEPYPTFISLDQFPIIYRQGLISAALLVGVRSQELFAVDTDIPSYCFVEGTPVTLADGSRKKIEDVRPGDLVTARDGTTQIVEAAWDEGAPTEVTEIKLWGRPAIQATHNHRWPVWAWPRECACGCGGALKPGRIYVHGHHARVSNPQRKCDGLPETKLVYGYNKRIPLDYEPLQELTSAELRPGDFLLVPRRFKEVSTDVTPSLARLIGYYTAEGSFADKGSGHPANAQFTLHEKERGTIARDIQEICAEMKIATRLHRSKIARSISVHTLSDYGRSLETKMLIGLLEAHVGEYSTQKRLSAEIMHWSLELKREFIRGLFRGDGSQQWMLQTQQGSTANSFLVSYSTASPYLAAQVPLILAQLGYPCRTRTEPAGVMKKNGKTYPKSELYSIIVPMPYAQRLADDVWGDDSKARDHIYGRDGWAPIRCEAMVDDDFVYIPVKSVTTKQNTKTVYNLTVSGDHSYLIRDIATFNSAQGTSFVIDHQPRLAAYLSQLAQWLDKIIPISKMKLMQSGTLHVQMGPNYRLTTLLGMSPSGALFRNMFFRA